MYTSVPRPELVSGSQNDADMLAGPGMAVLTTAVAGQTLVDLVRSPARKRSHIVPRELVRPAPVSASRASHGRRELLTAREQEVLRAIESGLATREIALQLGITINTVRTHAQRLMAKLRVHSRLQAASLSADGSCAELASANCA